MMKTYFQEIYKKDVIPSLQKEFDISNPMQIPELVKIVLNIGFGAEAIQNSKVADLVFEAMKDIAGQKPIITKAKKPIAAFKLRKDMPIGCKVTLRGRRMYEFLERLVFTALPRVRDFRGLKSSGFDGNGNYSMGIKEQIIFQEINYDKIDKVRGLDICIVTTAKNDNYAQALLAGFKMPFEKKDV